MNRSNKIGRLLRAFAGALVLGAALPAGCTDADDTLELAAPVGMRAGLPPG